MSTRSRWRSMLAPLALLFALPFGLSPAPAASTPDYLSAGDIAAIGVGSTALFAAGLSMASFDSTHAARWTRIAAYNHYVSDVAVGALVGWLAAELFYEFGDRSYRDLGVENASPLFITIRIPL